MKKKFQEERGSYRAVMASLRGYSHASSLCTPRVAYYWNFIASGTMLVIPRSRSPFRSRF